MAIVQEKTVLQVTGEPGVGKTETCKHLEQRHGFARILVSDLIRDYAGTKGISLRERADYKAAHLQLLAERGKAAITDIIMDHPSERVCVDGIRVPAYSSRLRELCGSKIMALYCPPELRFVRACERGDSLDKQTFEAFLHDEAQEARSLDPYVQSTLTVMEMADYRIDASQPLPAVLEAVDRIVPLVIPRPE